MAEIVILLFIAFIATVIIGGLMWLFAEVVVILWDEVLKKPKIHPTDLRGKIFGIWNSVKRMK